MVSTKLMTIAEFESLGSERARSELVKGEMHKMAAAGLWHGELGARLIVLLSPPVRSGRLGKIYGAETGYVVSRDPDSVLVPDVSFVKTDRLAALTDRMRFGPFAPDLAVEIESSSNRSGETLGKVALYLDGGTSVVWLIRPLRRTVTVFRPGEPELVLHDGDMLDGGEVIPGFSLPLAELFSDDF